MKIELVELYDKNKIKIPGSYDRYNLPNNETYYFAINLWIIINNKKILIQKRSNTKKIYPNKWECVAGGVLLNETLVDACIRETREEINLFLDKNNIELINVSLQKEYRYFMHTFVTRINSNYLNNIKINKEEVSEWKEVEYQELIKMIENDEFSQSIKSRFKKYKKWFNQNIGK